MKSCLCILEAIKPLKLILDSAMASKMKNIDPQKTLFLYPEDRLHPKKLHGLSEEPNPLTKPFRCCERKRVGSTATLDRYCKYCRIAIRI